MSDNIDQDDNQVYLDKLKLKVAELKGIGYNDEAVDSIMKAQIGHPLTYFETGGFDAGSEMETYDQFAIYADRKSVV